MGGVFGLKAGDLIEVVAPGSSVERETLEKGLRYLHDRGYRTKVSEKILEPYLYHSNQDEERGRQLQAAILNKESQAIWCLRGGYGSNRLLPYLDKIKTTPKWKAFIGISDVCSIHDYLWRRWKWPTLHASLLDRLGLGKLPADCEKETWDLLEGRKSSVQFANLTALNTAARKVKKISAKMLGGNLVTLESHWGTKDAFKLKNSFLFFEEIGERAYRIDRVLYHLRQTGLLKECKGVFFGQFTQCGEMIQGQMDESLVLKALQRFADEVKIPVFSGLESGHGVQLRPLPLGSLAEVRAQGGGFSLLSEWIHPVQKKQTKIAGTKKTRKVARK